MTRTHLPRYWFLSLPSPPPSPVRSARRTTRRASSPATPAIECPTALSANVTVRIDNAAAKPDLRVQLIDDAAAADFVLLDDGVAAGACPGGTAIQSVHLDPTAAKPDLTVALSRAPAAYKIYVRSAGFSQQDAAALFAAIWRNAGKTAGSGREFAARD